jgi:glycosyltransferase involved in cell wall biosynthesis
MRFGAGISGKVVQSLSYGLPVVTTSIGAEGLALTGSLKTMVADHSKELAGRIVDLYRNEPLWNELSRDAIAFVESNYSSAVARDRLQRLLEEQIDSIRRTVGFYLDQSTTAVEGCLSIVASTAKGRDLLN